MLKLAVHVLLTLAIASATARAQDRPPVPREEVPPHHQTAHDVAVQPLAGPRAEVVSGALLTASSPLVGVMVALLAGPGILACWAGPDPECEARREREQNHARRLALGIAIPWGVVGIGLITHGALRLHAIRAARREVAFTPTFDVARRSLGLQVRF